MNPVRTLALELAERDESELNDSEVLAQDGTDDFWFISLCLDTLHRLPSEVNDTLMCREYTALQAHSIIRKAMTELQRRFSA
jgi:hypothetical protein